MSYGFLEIWSQCDHTEKWWGLLRDGTAKVLSHWGSGVVLARTHFYLGQRWGKGMNDCMGTCMPQCMSGSQRHLVGVFYFPLLCGLWGLNSDYLCWQQSPLHTELSCWPATVFWRQCLSLNMELSDWLDWLDWLPSKEPHASAAQVLELQGHTDHCTLLFIWVVGFWTQGLMLLQEEVYLLSPKTGSYVAQAGFELNM